MKTRNYNRIGWFFILSAFLWVLVAIIDYTFVNILEGSSIADLIARITEPSAILASLAGLFFVLENLQLQRETLKTQQVSIEQQKKSIDIQSEELKHQIAEMQESNTYYKQQTETFRLQTAEATFFQLLENHRSLVMSLNFGDKGGYEGLNGYYKTLKECALAYFQAAWTKNIIPMRLSASYPERIMNSQIENTDQIYENVLHIIRFIDHSLDNGEFYHQTLYNTLSKAEKYILAFYGLNYKKEDVHRFSLGKLNYFKFFLDSGNWCFLNEKVPFFPHLELEFVSHWYDAGINGINSIVQSDWSCVRLRVINNERKLQCKLKTIQIEYNFQKQDYIEEDEWAAAGIAFSETLNLKLSKLLVNNLCNFILKKHSQGIAAISLNIQFKLHFVVEYDGNVFKYTCNCSCMPNERNKAITSLNLQYSN